jgi:hypothetical protein
MLLASWYAVGGIAVLATGLALLTADNAIAMYAGGLGFIFWLSVAYGALNIEVQSQLCDCVTIYSQPELSALAIALALLPGYIALTGPVDLIGRYRDGRPDDL